MKLNLIGLLLLSSLLAAPAWADGDQVTLKTAPEEEIYACNAGREFSGADLGTVSVRATGTGISTSRALTRNSPMLSPLATSWENRISQLSFGISGENYGASYSVYFCYIGPPPALTIDPATGKVDPKIADTTAGIYTATAAFAASLREYALKTKLMYNVQLSCQFRTIKPPKVDDKPEVPAPPTSEVETDYFASWGPYYFSSNRQITTQLNSNQYRVPTRCMFKLTLAETEKGIRPNAVPPAEFRADLDIFKIADENSLTEPAR